MSRRVVQVNVTAGRGSTGVIAEEIGAMAVSRGWESWIAYGREPHRESASRLIRVGSDLDVKLHGLESRLLDNHGLASRAATRRFVRQLDAIKPDVVHLHNIHGYYLNYPILFEWLRKWGGPVVWTLHDIWPITGHCAYFGVNECRQWRDGCVKCPRLNTYPASLLIDRCRRNFQLKKDLFASLPNLTLVPVSDWLSELLEHSSLASVPKVTIHNGVDLNVFKPVEKTECGRYILGVANVWEPRKGLKDFFELRKILPVDIGIILVGLSKEQIAELPADIQGIERTSSREELSALYSDAVAVVNPTYEDNFPTVNIEALAAGTPVVTYRTGGSPEAVDERTGVVVEQGDVRGLADAVIELSKLDRKTIGAQCRNRAEALFDKNLRYGEYIDAYGELTNVKNGGGYLIAVANVWTIEKGFKDIIALREYLPETYRIIIIGVSEKQRTFLPQGVIGITRTANKETLNALYSGAVALINPTYGDNFPTVNIETLAAGTPVVTYRTGGSPEAVDERTGVVVEQGDVRGLAEAVRIAEKLNPADCRARAQVRFNKDDRYREYLDLYERLLKR